MSKFQLCQYQDDTSISIGNRMNASAFRDLWARVMFLKYLKNFQNITRAHKSRNPREIPYCTL